MAKHRLSLEVPDVLNPCIIHIADSSSYAKIPTDCETLQITPPGFVIPCTITDLPAGFDRVFTACDMGIQITNCDNYTNNLMDGVWVLRWSVSPNDTVYVEYNYLRITAALNKYYKLLCCLDIAPCDPTPETKARLQELQLCRILFDAAKAQVEFCHQPKHGMVMYQYALERMKKLSCLCQCGC